MSILWACTVLTGGVLLLWKGADFLVAGAVSLAERFGISPLIIGLTVVAMGTSAPEVAASISAVLEPENGGDLALGNIFGSNIANLTLVGGIVVLIHPMLIKRQVLLREFPVMIGSILILWPVLKDEQVSRVDAGLLLLLFLVLLGFTVLAAKKGRSPATPPAETPESHTEASPKGKASISASLARVGIGLIGLKFGADLVISGAKAIGSACGLGDAVIGLVLVAPGTSLPELVTCVVAAFKGHQDISIGNLVGSNVFNSLLVTGSAGLALPFDASPQFAGGRDYLVMLGTSLLFWGIAIWGKGKVGRAGGSVLLITYIGYILYTVQRR